MSHRCFTVCSAVVMTVAALTMSASADRGEPQSAGDHRAVADFTRLVAGYVELHRRVEGPVPTVQVSSDPDEVQRAMAALAGKIRAERRRARQGDFFTPDMARVFRKVIAAACEEDFERVYEKTVEEDPQLRNWRPRVNGAYPEAATSSMISPQILCSLPELPEELQYRFWGRDLILFDYHANVIVDVLPNAIPST